MMIKFVKQSTFKEQICMKSQAPQRRYVNLICSIAVLQLITYLTHCHLWWNNKGLSLFLLKNSKNFAGLYWKFYIKYYHKFICFKLMEVGD